MPFVLSYDTVIQSQSSFTTGKDGLANRWVHAILEDVKVSEDTKMELVEIVSNLLEHSPHNLVEVKKTRRQHHTLHKSPTLSPTSSTLPS